LRIFCVELPYLGGSTPLGVASPCAPHELRAGHPQPARQVKARRSFARHRLDLHGAVLMGGSNGLVIAFEGIKVAALDACEFGLAQHASREMVRRTVFSPRPQQGQLFHEGPPGLFPLRCVGFRKECRKRHEMEEMEWRYPDKAVHDRHQRKRLAGACQ